MFFGGAGRAYDRTLYDYLQLEQTKFALAHGGSPHQHGRPSLPGQWHRSCVTWDPAFAEDVGNLQALLNGRAGEVNLINNDLKVPYSDQFSLGMRNRLGDWNTSVSVSRIDSNDGFVFTLGNRYPNGDFWQGRSSPGATRLRDSRACCSSATTASRPRPRRCCCRPRNRSPQESRWGTTFSYTFTRRHAQPRHQRALRVRCLVDRGIFIGSSRTRRPNIAWWRRARSRARGISCSRASSRTRRRRRTP